MDPLHRDHYPHHDYTVDKNCSHFEVVWPSIWEGLHLEITYDKIRLWVAVKFWTWRLDEKDKIKHKEDIQNNRNHLNSLKGKSSTEWKEYATKCMIEIMDNKV